MISTTRTCLAWLATLWAGCPWAFSAETLSVVPDSAQALGTVGGRFANLRDASAVRVSPANILEISSPELLINASAWHGDIQFESLAGPTLEQNEPWKFPGSAYTVVPFAGGRAAFGIGVSTPYGLSSDYDRDSPLRYVVPYEAQLLTLDLTPAVAFRVSNAVAVGVGMDILYSRLQIKQIYPWSAAAGADVPDGEIELDGDGWGVGGYIGVNWKLADRHRIALVGRLPLRVDYGGDFDGRGMPAGLAAAGFSEHGDFQSDITFPGSIAVGYGVDLSERLTLGADFQWSSNSSHDDIPLEVGSNQALLPADAVNLDWKDSIDLGAGVTYRLNDRWTLRAGYLFSEDSQGDRNYTPSVPHNDRHVFGVGCGWSGRRDSIDVAYAFVYNPDRSVTGAAQPFFNGEYQHRWHVLTVSYTHRF